MYTCKRCKIEKPLTDYYKTTDRKSGYKTICKECIKKDPLTEDRKKKMKVYGRKYHLNKKYNLTEEDYIAKLIEQNHKCFICGVDEQEVSAKRLFVDHCHKTGKIRKLLCHSCNAGLGLFKDSVQNLTKAISYLDSFK
jgi:hypothetical protein